MQFGVVCTTRETEVVGAHVSVVECSVNAVLVDPAPLIALWPPSAAMTA
jgi:hypothetical protein